MSSMINTTDPSQPCTIADAFGARMCLIIIRTDGLYDEQLSYQFELGVFQMPVDLFGFMNRHRSLYFDNI